MTSLAIIPSNENIVSGGGVYDTTIIVWNSTSFQPITTLTGHKDSVKLVSS